MKRVLSLLLALAILITLLPTVTLPVHAATVSGKCGDNLTWTISGDTLTISGTGPMYDYSENSQPEWREYTRDYDVTRIDINEGVTTIGAYAFGSFFYYILVEEVNLPTTLTSIGKYAFYDFDSLTTLTLPAGVTSIEPESFYDCTYLEEINVHPDNPAFCSIDGVLYNRDKTALYKCPDVTTIKIPDTVTTIKSYAFQHSNVSSVVLPAGLTTIEASAFESSYITSITIPAGVTRIEDHTFDFACELTEINLHDNITYIGQYAFAYTRPSTISLPNKLTEIGDYAFYDTAALKSLYIPASVKKIGAEIFADTGCELPDIYYSGSEADWNAIHIVSPNTALLKATKYYTPSSSDGGGNMSSGNLLVQTGEFQYNNSFTDDPWSFRYSYDESWFFNDNDNYQHDLCKMSVRVALAAYGAIDTIDGPANVINGSANIRALMDDLGFAYTDESISYPYPGYHTIGYAIGSKKLVNNDGETCSLILVALRGGGYGAEWGGNFSLGTEGDHHGFNWASTQVLGGLEDYLDAHEDELEDTIKVWIVGYSRSAATANLTAAKLNEGIFPQIKRDNVYAYCFETPQGTIDPDAHNNEYRNIISIVNPIDFVPKVAMSDWDFTRYGRTYLLPAREYNANYSEYKQAMADCYEDILDYNDYDLDTFEDPLNEGTYQCSALDMFFSDLCKCAKSRENYYRNLEVQMMDTAAGFLGGADSNKWGNLCTAVIEIVGLPILNKNTVYTSGLFANYSAPYAHYPELCMAWLDSLDESWFLYGDIFDDMYDALNQVSRRQYLINCPVDVAVYDADGTLVAQIINDEVQEMEDGLAAYIDDDGQKVVVLPGDGEYDVKLIATGDGTMSCTVEELGSETDVLRTVAYYDIEIEEGDILYSEAAIPEEDTSVDYPITLPDGTQVQPDVDRTPAEYAIDISVSGHGSAYGPATKLEGEYAALRATPDENESFLGWYNGETLVSSDAEYRFRVEQDISLTAKFSANHHTWDEGTVTTQPTATENGIKTFTCGVCGDTHTEIIPATGAEEKPFDPDTVRNPFSDVKKSAFYYTPVLWAVSEGVTSGLTSTTFGPDTSCTRGQVVTFLWRAAGSPKPTTTNCKFTDVSPSGYYYRAMLWAVENGITTGTSATTFSPDAPCTRGQVVTFLHRATGKQAPSTNTCAFTDISTKGFYYKSMLWAVENKITTGTGPTTFAPDATCTRGQVVTFLYRAYK